jgi:hypothetical protein
MTAGIVFSYCPLMRRKDGKFLRLKDRSQAFYNHHGQVLLRKRQRKNERKKERERASFSFWHFRLSTA